MTRAIVAAIALLALLTASSGVAAPVVDVVYPRSGHTTDAASIFVLGSSPARSRVTVNGHAATTYTNGAFVAVVPLRPGPNVITTAVRGPRGSATDRRTIHRTPPVTSLPLVPTVIRADTITPVRDAAAAPGESVRVAFQGSPGGRATFAVGNGAAVVMRELDAATAEIRGLYVGEYVLGAGDLVREPITVSLTGQDGRTVRATAPGTVTAWPAPTVMETRERVSLRATPAGVRLGALPEGVRVAAVAQGDAGTMVRLSPTTSVWIASGALAPSEGSAAGEALEIRTRRAGDRTEVRVTLSERLPFVVQQATDPERLTLTVYGVRASPEEIARNPDDGVLASITRQQFGTAALRLVLRLDMTQQWGYSASYDGATLVLAIRHAPASRSGAPLAGRIIAVDAGHGGRDPGATGATRLREKDANLAIARRVADLLRRAGATAVLTRRDDREVELDERVAIAERAGAEALVSVHANALPDGADPRVRHGTSTYYYQPHSRALAAAVHRALVGRLGRRDDGLRRQSFALTRPTEMPAVLVEIAYVIYPPEEMLLRSPAFRSRAALAIVRGLEAFFAADPAR